MCRFDLIFVKARKGVCYFFFDDEIDTDSKNIDEDNGDDAHSFGDLGILTMLMMTMMRTMMMVTMLTIVARVIWEIYIDNVDDDNNGDNDVDGAFL